MVHKKNQISPKFHWVGMNDIIISFKFALETTFNFCLFN